MYNSDYYAHVDAAMTNLWKDFGRKLLQVLDGTMRYLLILPIRFFEYGKDCIQTELSSQHDNAIRFRNLKQNGHI